MMVERDALLDYLDQLLQPKTYNDYCPNGLQVLGKNNIRTLVTGVTANDALIAAACAVNADALLVHHGFFWRGENPCITGYKHQRLKKLLQHDINLIAFHLPLDMNKEFGNNAQLAHRLTIIPQGQIAEGDPSCLVWHGVLAEPLSGLQLCDHVTQQLGRVPLHIEGRSQHIKTIAWCTGAAQDCIQLAVNHGCDAFLTGEVSERTVDIARETGIHFYAAGHYATERYGVQALGALLAERFDLNHQFIEIDNPV